MVQRLVTNYSCGDITVLVMIEDYIMSSKATSDFFLSIGYQRAHSGICLAVKLGSPAFQSLYFCFCSRDCNSTFPADCSIFISG